MHTKHTAIFKLRYGNTLAVLGILICIALLMSSKANEFRDTLVTLAVGVLIFVFYKYLKKMKIK